MSFTFELVNNEGAFSQGQHDIATDGLGNFITVTGKSKLEQDVEKILFTQRNYFYNEYGTNLDDFIGKQIASKTKFSQDVAQVITNSLIYLQHLQALQQKYQALDVGEVLEDIRAVLITYMADISDDPSALNTFKVQLDLHNAIHQNISVNKTITI